MKFLTFTFSADSSVGYVNPSRILAITSKSPESDKRAQSIIYVEDGVGYECRETAYELIQRAEDLK